MKKAPEPEIDVNSLVLCVSLLLVQMVQIMCCVGGTSLSSFHRPDKGTLRAGLFGWLVVCSIGVLAAQVGPAADAIAALKRVVARPKLMCAFQGSEATGCELAIAVYSACLLDTVARAAATSRAEPNRPPRKLLYKSFYISQRRDASA